MGFLERIGEEEEPSEMVHAIMGVLACYRKTNEPGWVGPPSPITRAQVRTAFNLTGGELSAMNGLMDLLDSGERTLAEVEGCLHLWTHSNPHTGAEYVNKQWVKDFLGL